MFPCDLSEWFRSTSSPPLMPPNSATIWFPWTYAAMGRWLNIGGSSFEIHGSHGRLPMKLTKRAAKEVL